MSHINNDRTVRYAYIGWSVLTIIMLAMIISGNSRSFDPGYRRAALNWLVGRDLYDGTGVGGFVYFPQAAMLFIPFALLPQTLGEVLWRILNIGAFAFGVQKFSRFAGEKYKVDLFPLMSLVTIPFAWESARNGQSTIIMTGMMLLSVVDMGRSRWWRATLWLSLGIAFKPLIIVFVLLATALYRPMTWRLLLGLAVVALSPLIIHSPDYVLKQYAACLHNMRMAARVGVVIVGSWTTPFNILRLLNINVPEYVQTVIRIIAAIATLALGFCARLRFNPNRSIVLIFSLAIMYLILFSPRTENNTYVMLGPVIAFFISNAILVERRYKEGILLCMLSLIMLSHRFFERMIFPNAEPTWLSPIIATCFTVFLLGEFFVDQMNYSRGKGLQVFASSTNRTAKE